jgi:hypothetical protein
MLFARFQVRGGKDRHAERQLVTHTARVPGYFQGDKSSNSNFTAHASRRPHDLATTNPRPSTLIAQTTPARFLATPRKLTRHENSGWQSCGHVASARGLRRLYDPAGQGIVPS